MRRRGYMTSVEKWLFALLAGSISFVLFSPAVMQLYTKLFGKNVSNDTAIAIGMLISLILVVLIYRFALS